MAQNPLIGSRISLISKKNIRYEGTLYSINEQDATVALQNVKSYGTEGREQQDPTGTFVPTQDAIHPYLVFRGSDIKDLHVHEKVQPSPSSSTSAPQQQKPTTATSTNDGPTTTSSPEVKKPEKSSSDPTSKHVSKAPSSSPRVQRTKEPNGRNNDNKATPKNSSSRNNNRQRGGSRKNNNPQHQVGTGASLLNRKARGAVDSANILPTPEDDFDFESNLANFEKEEEDNENDGAVDEQPCSYEKDNFFDSISCDAIDRQKGKDNRLRGAQERSLNTETFGAVALNSNRRYNRRGRGGYRGRGGGRGRGRGGGGRRGRGRGRSRYHGNSGRGTQVTTHNRAVAAS